ncbi:tRNA (guanine(10)-N(2))-dimethyltransferase [Palaeococcus sp. (in: euryarchaeotes)]
MELGEVREGKARILVPKAARIYDAPVFYNPVMAFNRDISVLALKVIKPEEALDALSATGVRGIRYALETPVREVWLNDINGEAFKLIKKNIGLNFKGKIAGEDKMMGEKTLVATNKDANLLMDEKFRYFDFVDLDPFGSPMPFLDAALRSVKRKGFLGITATDTGVLCGAYKNACLRKYNARPLRGELCHESGLRILIGAVVRYIGKYDLGFKVLLAYYRDHYFRVFLKMEDGARKGDELVEKLGYVYFDHKTGKFEVEHSFLPSRKGAYGPLWLGEMKDGTFIRALLTEAEKSELSKKKKVLNFLNMIGEELDVPFFYDIHRIAKRYGLEARKSEKIVESLRGRGFLASRTHISPTGIKTNAGLSDVVDVLRSLQ